MPRPVTSQLALTVDATQLTASDHLILGLYHPVASAGGISSLVFDVSDNGTSLIHQTFASASAAKQYFTDDALDLGSISSLTQGNSINLSISLQETTTSAGAGLFAGMLLGVSHA